MSTATAPTPTIAPASPRRLVDFVLRARTFGILGVLALFVLITTAIQPRFLHADNIRFILATTALYALVSVGETFVVITRNVDLSVGSVVGLSAYVSANMFQAHHGIPIPVVFLVGLGVGLACGVVTGLITAVGRVPSLVVTLAMLYIIRGVDTIIVGSGQVVANALPNSFINIFHATFLGIPVLAIAVAIVVAIAAYYLRSFRSGRELYAMGSDPDAARLGGIPIGRRIFGAFVLSGALAGLGGVLWATQYNTIDATETGERAAEHERAEDAPPDRNPSKTSRVRVGAHRIQLAPGPERPQVVGGDRHHDRHRDGDVRNAENRGVEDVDEGIR